MVGNIEENDYSINSEKVSLNIKNVVIVLVCGALTSYWPTLYALHHESTYRLTPKLVDMISALPICFISCFSGAQILGTALMLSVIKGKVTRHLAALSIPLCMIGVFLTLYSLLGAVFFKTYGPLLFMSLQNTILGYGLFFYLQYDLKQSPSFR